MQLPQAVLPLFDYAIGDILAALPEAESPLWDHATFRQNNYTPHRATRSIVFRWPMPNWQPGRAPVVLRANNMPPALAEAVDRCAEAIGARLGGEVVRVTLAELPAGGEVKAHVDIADRAAIHRCHVPIVTNADAFLVVDEQPHHLLPGTIYEFDNTRRHSARNGGATRRVHLLCDVMPPELTR